MRPESPNGSPELELKFQLAQGALDSLVRHPVLAQPGRRSRLRSIYFDTPEHDLRNSGLSLRVREQDGAFVQTLKSRTGRGVFERDEWEAAVDQAHPDPAALAETPAAKVLNGGLGDLAPVFVTNVERTVRLWNDGSNTIEVALDEGQVLAADRTAPLRELELELKGGDPQALFRLAGELAKEAPITLSFQSKAERGYRLAGHEGAAAIRAERTAVTPDMSGGAAFRHIARSCLGQVAGNAELLRSSRTAPLIHQTRVGARRFLAALSVFRPILDAEGLETARAETRWLAGELDPARDIDVFAETFFPRREDEEIEDACLAALHQRLTEAQAQAYERAALAVQSARFSALLLDVSGWVETGAWATAEDEAAAFRESPVTALAAARLERLHRRVARRGRKLKRLDATALHELRLDAKKLRYAGEFFAAAFDAPTRRTRRFGQAARTLQDRLGMLNDLAVARQTALRIVGPRASELAFTAGSLVGCRAREEPRMLRDAVRAFAGFAEAEPFWR